VEPGQEVGLLLRLRAAQLLKPGLVVSHRAAARLWQIETLATGPPDCLEFTDPALRARQSLADVRIHRIPLPQSDTVKWAGLRVTRVPRTLADLLRSGPMDDAVVAVESALTYRRVDGRRRPPVTTPAAVSLALQAPLLGSARARDWLRIVDLRTGSPAETVARLRMLDAGLRPETQAEVRIPDGRRRYVDFLFRPEGLAVEVEGYAYHGTRDAHRRDIARFNQILQCPEVRSLLRFSAEDVFHRVEWVVGEVERTLAALRR
jgi:very-short-patch-repair endonuclease